MEWVFKAIISGVSLYVAREMKEMRKSVEQLNVNVAVVIERQSSHERRLDNHDDEIKDLQNKE